ncbi:hypothetical protein M422DRAFT_34327 [Sphaerobolus stellatus SS14]|uniref:DUF6534 domain-containing protein n=1 Tax=Sphaerobolus stellatus (strain SS14) TaxID=990650 RepID=A0A0C9U0U2_SPHS4|nr:hypothetical protein M422DRAFT_34327 [Sphaerobolus stellatus SS14]
MRNVDYLRNRSSARRCWHRLEAASWLSFLIRTPIPKLESRPPAVLSTEAFKMYPGLFNSSYQPNPLELAYINGPVGQLGPPLLGQMFMTLLQGILLVQYYDYLLYFWNENRSTRYLVHGAAALCTLKFAYISWFVWDRYVVHYGDWDKLLEIAPLTVPLAISGTIPNAVCQVFYIVRCWSLSHNWFFLVPAVLSLLLAIGGGAAQTWGAAMVYHGQFQGFTLIVDASNVSLASGLTCDVFITAFTCYYLIRRKTGFTQTDGLVGRLMKICIESAAGPTLIALVNLILNNRGLSTEWFLLPNIVLSQVYGCSLMYTVNARRNVADKSLSAMVVGSRSSGAGKISKRGGTGTDSKNRVNLWSQKPWKRTANDFEMTIVPQALTPILGY